MNNKNKNNSNIKKNTNRKGNSVYDSSNYHWGMYSNPRYQSSNGNTNKLYNQLGGDNIFK